MCVFTIVCSLRKPHTGGGVLSPRSATMPFLLHSFIPSWCRAGVNGKCFITFHHPVFDHLQDARMDGKAYEHLSYEWCQCLLGRAPNKQNNLEEFSCNINQSSSLWNKKESNRLGSRCQCTDHWATITKKPAVLTIFYMSASNKSSGEGKVFYNGSYWNAESKNDRLTFQIGCSWNLFFPILPCMQ